MTRVKKGKYWYGSSGDDLKDEMIQFSQLNGYVAQKFSNATCSCGSTTFKLESDEDEDLARRICTACSQVVLMGDSSEFDGKSNFDNHICICDAEVFTIKSGVALYADSNDVRWYYIGCHCKACGLVGVFVHWKCEYENADLFLSKT